MGLSSRSFTYKRRIKVSPNDLRLAKAGKKTCTIRLGSNKVDGNSIDLSDGRESLHVRIISVETHLFGDLNEEHAKAEGFETLEELRRDLGSYYGKVHETQPATVISFSRLLE
jgi:hypothetical protein